MEEKTVTKKDEALGYILFGMKQIADSMGEEPEKIEDDLSHCECMLRLAKAYELVEGADREDATKRLDKLEKQVKDLAKYCH